jgi:pimeloyl-ACP methyl ester carboxylesterase
LSRNPKASTGAETRQTGAHRDQPDKLPVRRTRTVANGDIDLWTEAMGEPGAPCLLLVMAAYWQGRAWPTSFCERLASAGFRVIRYDHRDTGKSSVVDFSKSPYTLADLADDALAILDAYDVRQAHILGASMGGMVAQELALREPSRLQSLVSLMSTPLSAGYAAGTGPDHLPGPDEVAWKAFSTVPGPSAKPTRDEYVDGWTAFSRGVAGTISEFDENASRELHGASFDRAQDITAVWNHLFATQATPDRIDQLGVLRLPTLVVHGREDHVIPVAHANATADAIPGARLELIGGLGHQFDSDALAVAIGPILKFLRAVP